jgi:hypothetical protein
MDEFHELFRQLGVVNDSGVQWKVLGILFTVNTPTGERDTM